MHVNLAQVALGAVRHEVSGATRLMGMPDLAAQLGEAAELLLDHQTIIVTGMGKSGHVARKVAATMTSLGRRAVFLHPAEAAHGDLGLIGENDAILAFSWSGNTRELVPVCMFAEQNRIPVVGVTRDKTSYLGVAARVCVELAPYPEACHNEQAPTTSTTQQIIVGDALAVAMSRYIDWAADDFRAIHPGGALGNG